MLKSKSRRPAVESLEGRALLSGMHAHFHAAAAHRHFREAGAHRHLREAASVAPAVVVKASATPRPVGSTVNLTAGPAPSNGDVQALQNVASANNLVMFLDQLAILKGSRTDVQQAAINELDQARDVDLALHDLADREGTVLPADISPNDQSIAQSAINAANTPSFDQAILSSMTQAAGRLVAATQQAQGAAQAIQTGVAPILPIAQGQVTALQGLQGSGSGTGSGPATSTAPSSTTLSGSDLQILAKSYSTSEMEKFLAQFTALETRNRNVRQYAEKLVSDHESELEDMGHYAAATGTYLPASIQGQDVQTSQNVLRFAGSNGRSRSRFDRNYLSTMIRSHSQDIRDNQQILSATQNPTLQEFAMDDIPTDFLHRAGAQMLRR